MSRYFEREVKRLSKIVQNTEEPTLKETPMLTADGEEIKLNSILYRGIWEGGYGFNGKGNFEIEAVRVIHVNNSARQFRTRCAKGCESIHKVADGCSTERLFGMLDGVKAHIAALMGEDRANCVKKSKKVEETMSHLQTQHKSLIAVKGVKIPKPVKGGM
jgi:hypothetical protein